MVSSELSILRSKGQARSVMPLEVMEKKYLQFSKRSDWRVCKEFYFLLMFSHHGKIVNDCIFIESDICCKRVDIFYIRLERNRKVDNLPVCVCCASVAQVRSDLLSDFQIRS